MSVETSPTREPSDELTIEEVRGRCVELIERGFDLSETALIEAFPNSGKSFGSVKWAAQTGKPLTVLVPRHKLLEEYEDYCQEFGLDYWRVPSFYRDCESFDENGEPQGYGARKLKEEYERGSSAERLHTEHSDLPCQRNGECRYMGKRNFAPDDYDVLLGTYRHAYVEGWIEDRYVAVDEFPQDAFLKEFDDGVAPTVSAYLEQEDQLPFEKYWNFLERDENLFEKAAIEEWKESLTHLPTSPYDFSHVRESPNPAAHTLAPITTLALVEMESLDNDWKYANLGEGRVAVRNPKEDTWTFLLPPDLSSAESVIGLDGTPNLALWEIVLNEQIRLLSLFNGAEKKTYLQEVLDYRFVQTTGKWRAIQGWNGASPPKDLALMEGITQKEERTPALISSQKGIRQYDQEGLDEITTKVKYYGDFKGENVFEEERLGIVLGCPFPPDDEIEKWSALAGESAERKEQNGEKFTGTDTDFGPFGNRVMRTFVHDEVLQAAMRFGRKEVDGVRGATVYIHTSALPEWLPVEKQIPNIHSWTRGKGGMRKTVEAIIEIDEWRDCVWQTTDLYPHISELRRRTVRDRLNDLAEEGYIQFEGKQGRTKCYTNFCLEDAGRFGHVEFPE